MAKKTNTITVKWTERVARVLRSRKFYVCILMLFVLQGSFFALAINPSLQNGASYLERSAGVVPDGNRHMAAIYYYAAQPIQQGPFIHDMTDQELMMGDLVRFPSYMYYYLMSFPVRLALLVGVSDWAIVLLVRFIGLALGVLVLVVFRRLVREIGAGAVVANLATFGLAMTGSLAFLAPAENYDTISLLLWLVFLLASVRLFVRRDPTQLYWMALVFFVLSITKYTYLPFMGVTGLAALALYGRAVGWRSTYGSLVDSWRATLRHMTRWRLVVGGVVMVLAATLFVERIGVNLVQYGSVSPNCARVHSVESCMNFGVYARNYNRLAQVERGETWTDDYRVGEYTERWVERYYHTSYYYMGHIWVYDVSEFLDNNLDIVLWLMAFCLGVLAYRRRSPLVGQAEWFVLGVIVLFVVAQYGFNVRTFVQYSGEMYGHQGRYLLAIVGLVYVVLLLIVARAYRALGAAARPYFLAALLAIGTLALLGNAALPNFLLHANSDDWFSEAGKALVPEFLRR